MHIRQASFRNESGNYVGHTKSDRTLWPLKYTSKQTSTWKRLRCRHATWYRNPEQMGPRQVFQSNNIHLCLSTYVPGAMLGAFHPSWHLILTTLLIGYHYYPHLTTGKWHSKRGSKLAMGSQLVPLQRIRTQASIQGLEPLSHRPLETLEGFQIY